MKNSTDRFDNVIGKIHEYKEQLKQDLKKYIFENCKTYGDVEKILLIQMKDGHWNNNKLKILIVEELKEEVEREKNNLSVQ
ncbi:hypothetical protein BM74_27340 [Bacillus thuringiensis]|uniref:Uncharacterized protein n=1 Tax=Bacillus thuringiensis TaxID=1428 RepID=A0A437SDJ3_BACTU|nr:hypothetical protein [Bacillus thuringiensis]RVU61192.1 hypothetical protein BM74_27340 [Bacillus thuringiensis]